MSVVLTPNDLRTVVANVPVSNCWLDDDAAEKEDCGLSLPLEPLVQPASSTAAPTNPDTATNALRILVHPFCG